MSRILALPRHIGVLPWFSQFYFLAYFHASRSVLGSFLVFIAKIWPIYLYRSSISRFVFVSPFLPGTWDDHDLYYGHSAQEIIFTKIRDTIHADSLALLELNIKIFLADISKPEKSNIPTWTWPVTSLVTPGGIFAKCLLNFGLRPDSQ